MSQSQALTVISTPVADDPVPPAARALIPNYGDRVVQNGPGMHLNLAFTAGGVYLEAGLRGVAKLLELGPVPVVKAIETVFADAAQRIAILDELFLLRAPPPPADENSAAQLQPKASKTIVKLKKLCRKLLKFTSSSELPDTQLLAYKGIVMLTTRYIGLRLLFVEQLPFKDGAQQPSKHDIVDAWRHGSSGEPEWEFWLQFAAYCLASPDEITVAVETLKPSNFGCFEGGQCISERLSHWISSAFAANEESRLIAVRYLAGILELPSFWDFRIKNDLHSASDVLCLVCIRLLEDLAVECREQHFVRISDLVSLDPEGINVLVFAILNLLPLEQLPDDSIRSTTSLEIAKMLKQRLQTERSKALFPDASERAERFLQKPETAPDNPMDDAPAPRDILFIAVMGISGTGKSSFINMAVGSTSSTIGAGIQPTTNEIQEHRCGHPDGSGRNIVFIDTPGIGRYKTASDVLWAISGWLTDKYQGNVLLTGILFMHRITDNRVPGAETAHMRTQLLNALCGGSDLRNVVLVTTMCDEVEKAIITTRVADLQENFWQDMITDGSRVDSSYCHTPESAWDILNQFRELRPPQNNQS